MKKLVSRLCTYDKKYKDTSLYLLLYIPTDHKKRERSL